LKRRSCRGDVYWPSDRPRYAGLVAEQERKGERVRAGLLSPAEARTAEHLAHRSASTLLPTSAISKPAERAIGMCGKPADSSTRCSPDANFAPLPTSTTGVKGATVVETTGIEPATSWLQTRRSNRTQVLFAYRVICVLLSVVGFQDF